MGPTSKGMGGKGRTGRERREGERGGGKGEGRRKGGEGEGEEEGEGREGGKGWPAPLSQISGSAPASCSVLTPYSFQTFSFNLLNVYTSSDRKELWEIKKIGLH